MRIVATAGHVDHGKSSLVRALTGTDPDRFAEEKRRGLTIDLGFAHTTLPSGEGISFIDVPGHIRFVRNMLAGVGAVDACLFVVAATEGWMPQSEEHLRILDLLGVRHGVIALTKVDLVDDELRELAALDVIDHVAGTFLAAAPMISVAAPAGTGLDDLRSALEALVHETPAAEDRGRPRLWIDRVFTAKGSGTVVTATLTGGSLHSDDHVMVGDRREPVRIRAIQSLGSIREHVGPGNRVALNLAGVEHKELRRGQAIVMPGQWLPTQTFDASLRVLEHVDHEVSRRGAYLAYIGSGEFPVRLRVLGTQAVAPGQEGLVRLHLAVPVPLLPGDRHVIRESGRAETIGGGEVLDIHPVLPASRARPDHDISRLVRERGWTTVTELELLTGDDHQPTVGTWVVDPEALHAAVTALRVQVTTAGALGLDLAELGERSRALVPTMTDITIDGGRVRLADAEDPLADHPFAEVLRRGRFSPPDATGIGRLELRELVRRGVVVERDGAYFHHNALAEAATLAARLLVDHPEGFTVAQFRDATQSTRKQVLPLVAELDARGVTRRRGDVRVAGPRLPRAT